MRGYDDFKKHALGKRKDMKLKQYWYNPKSGKVWPFDGHYGGDEALIKLVDASWNRVVWGCDMLIDNCCDPEADCLELRQDWAKAIEAMQPAS